MRTVLLAALFASLSIPAVIVISGNAGGGSGTPDELLDITAPGYVDPYDRAADEITGIAWDTWDGDERHDPIRGYPITFVAPNTGRDLMVGVHKDDADLLDGLRGALQRVYPDLRITVTTVGDMEWGGPTINVTITSDTWDDISGIGNWTDTP